MMKWLSRIAVSALLVFGFGCAGGAATADSAEWTRHSESKLGSLAGQWTGINKLWFMPGDPVRESESECSVTFGAAGTVALISYTWDYEGQSQEGVMMVRAESGTEDVQVSWIDTWHTQSKFMSFEPEEGVEGMVAVRCSYAAPPGPDWGWRIMIDSDDADEFHIVMHNIMPDGKEMLAVDARYARG